MSRPFEPGERAMLIDARGRTYLVRLESGRTFHFHGGGVAHDQILGNEEGVAIESAGGMTLSCFRPRLADFVLKMPRGAQVIYPKDLATILVYADVFPGARVLEAGTGSGALTLALCRAVGPEGRVVSFELRPEFQAKATQNIEAFLGKLPSWLELREGDLREVGESGTGEPFDRVVLDVPDPWDMLETLDAVLAPGGILCSYLPTIGQAQTLTLRAEERGYRQIETFETLLRSWHVTARSLRPDHRMVGHTGFLTIARRPGRTS